MSSTNKTLHSISTSKRCDTFSEHAGVVRHVKGLFLQAASFFGVKDDERWARDERHQLLELVIEVLLFKNNAVLVGKQGF
jgi:hypothetical protein